MKAVPNMIDMSCLLSDGTVVFFQASADMPEKDRAAFFAHAVENLERRIRLAGLQVTDCGGYLLRVVGDLGNRT